MIQPHGINVELDYVFRMVDETVSPTQFTGFESFGIEITVESLEGIAVSQTTIDRSPNSVQRAIIVNDDIVVLRELFPVQQQSRFAEIKLLRSLKTLAFEGISGTLGENRCFF
ncbi:hypothetical protein BMS3Bbin04_01141 [bacterium BMS3Bbin04]|nr:hypothetical protein BMS3Bbin04_01141 [bacterium BMS3Bbin04]